MACFVDEQGRKWTVVLDRPAITRLRSLGHDPDGRRRVLHARQVSEGQPMTKEDWQKWAQEQREHPSFKAMQVRTYCMARLMKAGAWLGDAKALADQYPLSAIHPN